MPPRFFVGNEEITHVISYELKEGVDEISTVTVTTYLEGFEMMPPDQEERRALYAT